MPACLRRPNPWFKDDNDHGLAEYSTRAPYQAVPAAAIEQLSRNFHQWWSSELNEENWAKA